MNASRNDKDYIAAVNWAKAAEYAAQGEGEMVPADYVRNYIDSDHIAKTKRYDQVRVLDPTELRA
ncbi:MAG: hypothetical protein U5K31_06880 [Balneolaceae bacterium]|nr:hypothetical protein [Balneolaceae bacterium]